MEFRSSNPEFQLRDPKSATQYLMATAERRDRRTFHLRLSICFAVATAMLVLILAEPY